MPVDKITINIQSPRTKHIYFMVDVEEMEISPIRAPILAWILACYM